MAQANTPVLTRDGYFRLMEDRDSLLEELNELKKQPVSTERPNVRLRTLIKTTAKDIPYPEMTTETTEWASPPMIRDAMTHHMDAVTEHARQVAEVFSKANSKNMTLFELSKEMAEVQPAGPVAVEATGD